MREDIINRDDKDELHGYQEWYWHEGIIWQRGKFKHGRRIDYNEFHRSNIDSVGTIYYIK